MKGAEVKRNERSRKEMKEAEVSRKKGPVKDLAPRSPSQREENGDKKEMKRVQRAEVKRN